MPDPTKCFPYIILFSSYKILQVVTVIIFFTDEETES